MWSTRSARVLAVGALAVTLTSCASNAPDARSTRDLTRAERIVAGYDEARSTRSARMDGVVRARVGERYVTIPIEVVATCPSRFGTEPIATFKLGLSLKKAS